MKILFLGNGQRAKACLEKIIETDDITSITVEPTRSGDIVEDFASENNIAVYHPNSFTEGSDPHRPNLNLLEPDNTDTNYKKNAKRN